MAPFDENGDECLAMKVACKMKVVRLDGAGVIDVLDEPRPDRGPGESLVRVGAIGLCGSDLHWFGEGGIGDAAYLAGPLVGHEFGRDGGERPPSGCRVAVDPAIPDYTCERCREGNTNLCPRCASPATAPRTGRSGST